MIFKFLYILIIQFCKNILQFNSYKISPFTLHRLIYTSSNLLYIRKLKLKFPILWYVSSFKLRHMSLFSLLLFFSGSLWTWQKRADHMGLTQQKKKIRRVTGSSFNKKRVNIDQKKKGITQINRTAESETRDS